MKRSLIHFTISTLLLFGLFACGDTEEQRRSQSDKKEQSKAAFQPAEQKTTAPKATTVSPDSKATLKGSDKLSQAQLQKNSEQQQQAYEAIQSIPRVITGYKSIYRKWPQTMQDLDNGEYFFDSSYLAETIPPGYKIYLALLSEDPGFKVWAAPANSDSAFQLTETGKKVLEIDNRLMQQEIDAGYRITAQKDSLTFLTPK